MTTQQSHCFGCRVWK